MRNATHYESGVVEAQPGDTVCKIVEEMRYYAVGCVVVTDAEHRPLGIVTDRDLLCRVIRTGRDPEKTLAEEVMTRDLVVGSTDDPLERLLEKMRASGARRVPIVHSGRVVGLVSLDDIVAELGGELADIREALRSEVFEARRAARRRRRREEVAATLHELRTQVANLGADSREWVEHEIETLRNRLGGG